MVLGGYFVKYVPLDSIGRRLLGNSHIQPFQDFFKFLNIMTRVLVLFRPQRFFAPLSFCFLLVGLGLGIFQLGRFGGIFGSTLLCIISSVIFFCFGLLSEQLAVLRREHNKSEPKRITLKPDSK